MAQLTDWVSDYKTLTRLGYSSLTEDQASRLWKAARDLLEQRIGTAIAAKFSESEISDFEAARRRNDEAAMRRSLELGQADYQAITLQASREIADVLTKAAKRPQYDE